MSELDADIREIIGDILHNPHNLAMPNELETQAIAASRAFDDSDLDKSGSLGINEIESICDVMGLPSNVEDGEYFDSIDNDKSGMISKLEFIKWWLTRVSKLPGTQHQQEVIARNTFKKFDVDNSGSISCIELGKLTSALGIDFSDAELQQAITELDTDQSGILTIDEFVSWWTNRSSAARRGGGLVAIKLKKLANKAARVFFTDIHTAAWNGDLELLKMFLQGAEGLKDAADSTEFGDDWTPLHYACAKGHIEIVKELLRLRANKDSQTSTGFTPLFVAAQNSNYKICELLLEQNANTCIFGTNPDFPLLSMCPSDFIVDNSNLRNVFSSFFSVPSPPSSTFCELQLSLSGGGIICNFQISKLTELKEISKLPIKSWHFILQTNSAIIHEYKLKFIDYYVLIENKVGENKDNYIKKYALENKHDSERCVEYCSSNRLHFKYAAENDLGLGIWSNNILVKLSSDRK